MHWFYSADRPLLLNAAASITGKLSAACTKNVAHQNFITSGQDESGGQDHHILAVACRMCMCAHIIGIWSLILYYRKVRSTYQVIQIWSFLRIHVGWAIDQSWRGTFQTHTWEKVNLRAKKTDRTRRMLERKGREWELVTDNLVSFFVTNRNDTSRERNRCYVCTLS